MLSQLLAWIYSINHRWVNIVEDFDSSITFVSKEFFISAHMNRSMFRSKERERERDGEREQLMLSWNCYRIEFSFVKLIY